MDIMEHQVVSRIFAKKKMELPNHTFLHAEANAITKLARSGNNSDGSTLYVTASPCIECAKLIIQAGIKRVVYGEKYRLTEGIDLLKRANIEIEFLNIEDDESEQK